MYHFTAEFGMGSGGSKALLPPGKLVEAVLKFSRTDIGILPATSRERDKSHSLHLVVLSKDVSCEVKLTVKVLLLRVVLSLAKSHQKSFGVI